MTALDTLCFYFWPVGVTLSLLMADARLGLADYQKRAAAPPPLSTRAQVKQTGKATWYGPGFHGQETASGEPFNQHELTAAHPTLPLGTRAKVTNLETGKAVEVKINDRAPAVKGRVIDLSRAAAQKIGIDKKKGTALVEIQAAPPRHAAEPPAGHKPRATATAKEKLRKR
jgi:rare lipoprotein A